VAHALDSNGHVIAFNSMYGGKSWTKAVNVATYISHAEAGGLRSAGLISSAVDAVARCCSCGQIAASARTARRMTSCTARRQPGRRGRRSSACRLIALRAQWITSSRARRLRRAQRNHGPHCACVLLLSVSSCAKLRSLRRVHSVFHGRLDLDAQNHWPSNAADVAAGYVLRKMVAIISRWDLLAARPFQCLPRPQAKSGSLFHEAIYTTTSGQT